MATLKVPTLQHLSRFSGSDLMRVKKRLVQIAQSPPTFNYNPLYSATYDMLLFRTPYNEIVKGIRKSVLRADVRDNFLGVLPLIRDHFEGIHPEYVQEVGRRFYPVGRNLMVPFDPKMIYGISGQIYFPWFSFWRSQPLRGEALSLFVTLVDEMLLQDPDLEGTEFQILDFSSPIKSSSRQLQVIDGRVIQRLETSRKVELLEIFAEAYHLALIELAQTNHERAEDSQKDPEVSAQLRFDL